MLLFTLVALGGSAYALLQVHQLKREVRRLELMVGAARRTTSPTQKATATRVAELLATMRGPLAARRPANPVLPPTHKPNPLPLTRLEGTFALAEGVAQTPVASAIRSPGPGAHTATPIPRGPLPDRQSTPTAAANLPSPPNKSPDTENNS